MKDEISTHLPVRGTSLVRMLVSLTAVGAVLGYWASHQTRPVSKKRLALEVMYCQCYDEHFPAVDTGVHRKSALQSLIPAVADWLNSDPVRARRLGAPISSQIDREHNDLVQQWVRFSSGRALTFYTTAGELYAIKEDTPA